MQPPRRMAVDDEFEDRARLDQDLVAVLHGRSHRDDGAEFADQVHRALQVAALEFQPIRKPEFLHQPDHALRAPSLQVIDDDRG